MIKHKIKSLLIFLFIISGHCIAADGATGDRVVKAGVALTVTSTSTTGALSKYLKPSQGNIFLTVDVIIENVGRDSMPYNPMYFKAKDSDGYEYPAKLVTPTPKALNSGTLTRGEKIRGIVIFDMPKPDRPITLKYLPVVFFAGYDAITITL